MLVLDKVRSELVANLELVGGRHDEPEIYDGEPGDPGLAGGPDSMSWEINGDWQHDDNFSTEVELRFVLVSPLQTRIEFEHRQLERFGDKAVAARGAMDDGWGTVLALYAARAGKTT